MSEIKLPPSPEPYNSIKGDELNAKLHKAAGEPLTPQEELFAAKDRAAQAERNAERDKRLRDKALGIINDSPEDQQKAA